MIDTDKYEGHTPAPWDGILSGYFTIEQLKGIDKTLMQDAPLLLEEVKRLREQLAKANKYVYGICQHSDSMMMDYEDYMKGDEEE